MNTNHKPLCKINIACAVDHHGAPCPGPYGICDCGVDSPSSKEVRERIHALAEETIKRVIQSPSKGWESRFELGGSIFDYEGDIRLGGRTHLIEVISTLLKEEKEKLWTREERFKVGYQAGHTAAVDAFRKWAKEHYWDTLDSEIARLHIENYLSTLTSE